MTEAKNYSTSIYLAGQFSQGPALRELGQALEKAKPSGRSVGFRITAPWYDFDQVDPHTRSTEETKRIGQAEYDGVVNADYYVAIINNGEYAYKGTLTEMGIALGSYGSDAMRVYLITPTDFTNANCVALCVPHTGLAVHVPIMNGTSISDNIGLIVDWARVNLP